MRRSPASAGLRADDLALVGGLGTRCRSERMRAKAWHCRARCGALRRGGGDGPGGGEAERNPGRRASSRLPAGRVAVGWGCERERAWVACWRVSCRRRELVTSWKCCRGLPRGHPGKEGPAGGRLLDRMQHFATNVTRTRRRAERVTVRPVCRVVRSLLRWSWRRILMPVGSSGGGANGRQSRR